MISCHRRCEAEDRSRDPHIGLAGEAKTRGQHPDDGKRLVVGAQRAADGSRVPAEVALLFEMKSEVNSSARRSPFFADLAAASTYDKVRDILMGQERE